MVRIFIKTKNEYLENEGWSSRKFLHHAKVIFEILEKLGFEMKFARTVIYIKKNKKTIKVRVHHNGRTNDWMTITNKRNEELASFHYADSTENILRGVLNQF